ncbi:hypothetical protein BDW68DRAFT_126116 [Aspergillus falconensis]
MLELFLSSQIVVVVALLLTIFYALYGIITSERRASWRREHAKSVGTKRPPIPTYSKTSLGLSQTCSWTFTNPNYLVARFLGI